MIHFTIWETRIMIFVAVTEYFFNIKFQREKRVETTTLLSHIQYISQSHMFSKACSALLWLGGTKKKQKKQNRCACDWRQCGWSSNSPSSLPTKHSQITAEGAFPGWPIPSQPNAYLQRAGWRTLAVQERMLCPASRPPGRARGLQDKDVKE